MFHEVRIPTVPVQSPNKVITVAPSKPAASESPVIDQAYTSQASQPQSNRSKTRKLLLTSQFSQAQVSLEFITSFYLLHPKQQPPPLPKNELALRRIEHDGSQATSQDLYGWHSRGTESRRAPAMLGLA